VLAPLLAAGKLIAEPWDLGPHGYQVGNFPRGWLAELRSVIRPPSFTCAAFLAPRQQRSNPTP
jgi:hypothetical protein